MSFFKNENIINGSLGFQVDFENKLIILTREEAAKFSKEINTRFTMQEYNDTFLVFSGGKGIILRIELDKITITSESGSLESFSSLVKDFCRVAMENFEFKKFSRIGFRVSAINKRKSLNEAIDGYYNIAKFDKKEMLKVGKLMGFQLISTIKTADNMTCNININPVVRQNITIGPTAKDNKRINDFGIMADVDCFYDGAYAKEITINAFMDSAISNLDNKIYPMIEAVK